MKTEKKLAQELIDSRNGEAPAQAPGETIQIKPLRMRTVVCAIRGVAPYMQLRFSVKGKSDYMNKQKAGSQSGSKKVREAKNFDELYKAALYQPKKGGFGIPAAAFRAALISACRIVGFKMTLAKLSVFVEADDKDNLDGTPLVALHGEPQKSEMVVRNATGVIDVRIRPVWQEWTANPRIRFDEDLFSLGDVANLLARVGAQVGIGEGRPDSRSSAGLGFGLFEVTEIQEIRKK